MYRNNVDEGGKYLNIAGLQYNLNRRTLEIYVSGCYGKCKDCHNEEIWDFAEGTDFRLWFPKLKNRMETGLVDSIWLLGGDPMDQNKEELIELIDYIRNDLSCKDLWLWTRYPQDEIPNKILNRFNYLKTGEFLNDGSKYTCPLTGIELASSNQKIIKLN